MPRLLAFSDQLHHSDSVSALADLCLEAKPGEVVVVLRDRELEARERFLMGERLLSAAERGGQMLVVADRADMARALGAGGLHLPAAGFSPKDARAALSRPSLWLSRSSHGLDELSDDQLAQLTAAVISPVWEARKGRAPLGAEGLRLRIESFRARAPQLLVYALGGISHANAPASLQSGADGVAVMGVLTDAPARRRLLSALDILR